MAAVKVPTLETDRLILRMWKRRDAGALFEYAKDPDVGPNAGWRPHATVMESAMIISSIFRAGTTWAIEEKETGKPVGSISLDADKFREGLKSRELGYSLAKRCWGKGYMTEASIRIIRYAFDTLGLEVLTIRTSTTNDRSQRVIDKQGFVYEGTLRKAHKMYDGTIRDIKVYSMSREEYLKILDRD